MTTPTPTPSRQYPQLLRGKARMRELAADAETERQAVAAELEQDLGRAPSASERVMVEQLSMLIVRGRRLRQCGKGADAEMVARLVLRGMTKLGIRHGPAKSAGEMLEEIAASYARTRSPA